MTLIQSKNYTSCNVCNKLNNGKFLFVVVCILVNPVGLILNIFICCIVNIHVLYEYEIDLIATDNCDVTLYFCGPKGWMQCL